MPDRQEAERLRTGRCFNCGGPLHFGQCTAPDAPTQQREEQVWECEECGHATRITNVVPASRAEAAEAALRRTYRALENVDPSHDKRHNLKWALEARDLAREALSGGGS